MAGDGLCTAASAQVKPDQSLGSESSTVQNRFGTQQIGGGATRGTTRFHSFSMFNLGSSDRAYFDSPTGITTIFSRVTGQGKSTIDGTLGVSGVANLFFMNPNGIIFGPGARLDLQGSATFTTADRITFDAGQQFSASASQSAPLLAVNLPTGLQWGTRSGTPDITPERTIVTQGANLEVAAGKSLRLFGNGVDIQGGALRSREGKVTIASVSQNETLALKPDGEAQIGQTRLAPLDLRDSAAIEVSGNSSGSVNLSGSRVTLKEGATIFADVFGSGQNSIVDGINITATDRVEILGDPVQKRSSFIMSDTLRNATGNSTNILITTPNLILKDGGRIQTRTYGTGNGGNITIRSANIDATGGLIGVPLPDGRTEDIATGILSRVEEGASGNGGTVRIEGDRISLTRGPEFRANTLGVGRAGNFIVNAKTITLVGGIPEFFTGFSTSTGNNINPEISGRGGDLSITADRLSILDGAAVRTGTSGRGDAGHLNIAVQDLLVSGIDRSDGTPSNLRTSSTVSTRPNGARVVPSGRSGDLSIVARQIQVLDGGLISSNSTGSGNAGNMTLRSQSLDVAGGTLFTASHPANTGIRRSVISNATAGSGDAGILSITSDRFSVRNGAQVSSATRSSGNGGLMIINAGTIDLVGAAPNENFPTGLFVSVEPKATGNGGGLRLSADRLTITDGSAISADTFSSGRGSDVSLNVKDSIVIRGTGPLGLIPSRISSGSRESLRSPGDIPTGSGGNLSITTGLLTVDQGGILTAATVGQGNAGTIGVTANQVALRTAGKFLVDSSGQGKAGNIEIHTNQLDLEKSASIRAETAQGIGGDIVIDSRDYVFLTQGSSITTDAKNTGDGGNIMIRSKLVFQSENSTISANAVKGRGGNITIEADGILTSQDSRISASSALGLRGKVTQNNPAIDDRSATNIAEPESPAPDEVLANSCFIQRNEKQGRFVVTGNGGLPESPTEPIVALIETTTVTQIESQTIAKAKTVDKRTTKPGLTGIATPDRFPEQPLDSDRLTEATEIRKGADGSVVLAAGNPTLSPREQAVCDRAPADP